MEAIGDYWHNERPYGIFLNGGGFEFSTDQNNTNFLIEIENNQVSSIEDCYGISSYNNLNLNNGISISGIHWQLNDPSGLAINSVSLTDSPPVLTDWPLNRYLTIDVGVCQSRIACEVTSVYLIPEPISLFLLSLGGVLTVRKRSKRS